MEGLKDRLHPIVQLFATDGATHSDLTSGSWEKVRFSTMRIHPAPVCRSNQISTQGTFNDVVDGAARRLSPCGCFVP